ncbi:MAG: hypothetical protein HFF08_07245 [Oscillospiraceae bacterium]|nr:hypothetical protein [Oscillospiraceae bacterium]
MTETGAVYDLTPALLGLSWEEQEGELAQRARVTLLNFKLGASYLMQLVKINCILRLWSNWGAGRKKVFEGIIWDWDYDSAQNKELSVLAYDPMIRLKSKDILYFSAGMSTPAILESVCGGWGVPLDYQWDKQITHTKKIFNGEAVSDIIISLLNEVRQQTGERYVIYYKDGKLTVSGLGKNKEVYRLDSRNTISTSDKLSIDNLVTRVKILGKADDDGRSNVEATVDGNLKFGVLQEVIRRDVDKDLGSARADAQTILKERGKPAEEIRVNAPDLPFMRKGDLVEISAGNLIGMFYVMGVSHDAKQKTMEMRLLRKAG